MRYTRTVSAKPPPAAGRRILATALLEAPDINGKPGEWETIEAKSGEFSEVQTHNAEKQPGWYRLQWHYDSHVSKFSDPVLLDNISTTAVRQGLGGR